MIDKKTVLVLGAGASCPYGYPHGASLRELICFDGGFRNHYLIYLNSAELSQSEKDTRRTEVTVFIKAFRGSHVKSIDVFMANNPKLAQIGKYIIAHEIFRAEGNSCFGEEAKRKQEELEDNRQRPERKGSILAIAGFHGGDWYFHLYNRLVEGLVGKDALPDFSNGNLAFITFNYDRSLEYFLFEALRNSFAEAPEDRIVESLQPLKILHVYGQIAPLKWQNPDHHVDYKPRTDESLLLRAADNMRTIYEEKLNPELIEAQDLLRSADEIFFLGFAFAPENMKVLGLPGLILPRCQVYGTAFNMIKEEVDHLYSGLHTGRARDNSIYVKPTSTLIDDVDCLMLLRKHLR